MFLGIQHAVVLNNYEQVGWVLNQRAQWMQSSIVIPTTGPQGQRGEKRQKREDTGQEGRSG